MVCIFASIVLASVAISNYQVQGLECLVIDKTIGYYGFINDPAFVYCGYNPVRGAQHFESSGISNKTDDIEMYDAFFEDVNFGGRNIFKIPHVCFVQKYQLFLGHRDDDIVNKCICQKNRCNIRSEFPWWLRTFDGEDIVLNKSITPREYEQRVYQDTIRRYQKGN